MFTAHSNTLLCCVWEGSVPGKDFVCINFRMEGKGREGKGREGKGREERVGGREQGGRGRENEEMNM